MNIQTDVNFAFAQRGMLPINGHCKCAVCQVANFDRDEMATEGTHERYAEMVQELGGTVCRSCADHVPTCEWCGAFLSDPSNECGNGGFICDTCASEPDHYAQERHGWEQV